ncbi:hypothetical protein BJ165DRAFT_213828 [Panaeolus papilionaceus]|nr:hypothetical protein BJ165DRAFT_213828 [Panaeolus papilionaceus]
MSQSSCLSCGKHQKALCLVVLNPAIKKKDCDPSLCLEDLKLLTCGSCGLARYCSKECQRSNWRDHKEECRVAKSLKQIIGDRTQDAGVSLKQWVEDVSRIVFEPAISALKLHLDQRKAATHIFLLELATNDAWTTLKTLDSSVRGHRFRSAQIVKNSGVEPILTKICGLPVDAPIDPNEIRVLFWDTSGHVPREMSAYLKTFKFGPSDLQRVKYDEEWWSHFQARIRSVPNTIE